MSKPIDAIVFSKKNHKTLTVLLVRKKEHKMYGKHIKTNTKLQVHDELNFFRTGDAVKIISCRPFSKLKRWKVLYNNSLNDTVGNASSSIRQ